MSVYSTLAIIASEWRAARQHAHTQRVLSGLPNEVLKDIGWPEADRRLRAYRSSLGSWGGAR